MIPSPMPMRMWVPTMAAVTVGAEHTCGVLQDGSAFCWGKGADGRLGTGNEVSQLNAARVVSG